MQLNYSNGKSSVRFHVSLSGWHIRRQDELPKQNKHLRDIFNRIFQYGFAINEISVEPIVNRILWSIDLSRRRLTTDRKSKAYSRKHYSSLIYTTRAVGQFDELLLLFNAQMRIIDKTRTNLLRWKESIFLFFRCLKLFQHDKTNNVRISNIE